MVYRSEYYFIMALHGRCNMRHECISIENEDTGQYLLRNRSKLGQREVIYGVVAPTTSEQQSVF